MAVGCASHTYTITDRGGGLVAAGAIMTDVEYNRVLNDMSDATVTLAVSDDQDCQGLGGVRTWRHLLNIYRGDAFMWSGFVDLIEWRIDSVTVHAVDIIGLMDRRVPHKAFNYASEDPTRIARDLIEDALAPDDPGHRVTIVSEADEVNGRVYERYIGQTSDHLRDLSDTGIDFTTIGNNIILMGDRFCEVVGRLSDDDLPDGLVVAEDASKLGTRQIVAGTSEGSAVGVAGGRHEYYGLLEIYAEQNTITSQSAANSAAQAKLAGSLAAPVFIDTQNVTLSPLANVEVSSLVPGWCLDITSDRTCRTITQRLKITGLKVTEGGGSDTTAASESVTVQVAAPGAGYDTEEVG